MRLPACIAQLPTGMSRRVIFPLPSDMRVPSPMTRASCNCSKKTREHFFSLASFPNSLKLANSLPLHLRKDSPLLCIAAAWAGLASNHHSEIPAWLNAIEYHFGLPAESAMMIPLSTHLARAALLEVLASAFNSHSRAPAPNNAHIFSPSVTNSIRCHPSRFAYLTRYSTSSLSLHLTLVLQAEETGDLSLAAQAFTEVLTLSRQTQNSNLFHLAPGILPTFKWRKGSCMPPAIPTNRRWQKPKISGK